MRRQRFLDGKLGFISRDISKGLAQEDEQQRDNKHKYLNAL